MPAIEIRPCRATELVDASFQLIRRYYPHLVTVSSIAMAPGLLLRILKRDELSSPQVMLAHPMTLALVSGVTWLLLVAAGMVLTVAVSDSYLQGDVDIGRAFGVAIRKCIPVLAGEILRYIGIFAITTIAVMICAVFVAVHAGVLLIVLVPLVVWLFGYLWLRTFAVTPAILLEGMGPVEANFRSWRLSKDCTAHLFFSVSLAIVLSWVVNIIVSVLGATVLSQSTAAIIGAVAFIFIYPLFSAVWTLVYYDLRIRKEGFDLEIMSRELGSDAAPLPAA
ncbi:MAG: hypothetical protein JJD97_08825 [Gemmatimonadaceae bacterium]|nr:hypothetical protein [Gemmatimonadaceae bacterium]